MWELELGLGEHEREPEGEEEGGCVWVRARELGQDPEGKGKNGCRRGSVEAEMSLQHVF